MRNFALVTVQINLEIVSLSNTSGLTFAFKIRFMSNNIKGAWRHQRESRQTHWYEEWEWETTVTDHELPFVVDCTMYCVTGFFSRRVRILQATTMRISCNSEEGITSRCKSRSCWIHQNSTFSVFFVILRSVPQVTGTGKACSDPLKWPHVFLCTV